MHGRHRELGQTGGGRKGGHVASMAVQLFHNRGDATERDHDGAQRSLLTMRTSLFSLQETTNNNSNIMIQGSHIIFFKSVSLYWNSVEDQYSKRVW